MRQSLLLVLAVGLLTGLLSGRSDGQGVAKGIQGTWTIFSIEDDGKPVPVPKDGKVSITKDKFVILAEGKPVADYACKIDGTKTPKWIDLTQGKQKVLGIYEMKGDQLRICLGNPGGARATGFVTKDKSDNDVLLILHRGK